MILNSILSESPSLLPIQSTNGSVEIPNDIASTLRIGVNNLPVQAKHPPLRCVRPNVMQVRFSETKPMAGRVADTATSRARDPLECGEALSWLAPVWCLCVCLAITCDDDSRRGRGRGHVPFSCVNCIMRERAAVALYATHWQIYFMYGPHGMAEY